LGRARAVQGRQIATQAFSGAYSDVLRGTTGPAFLLDVGSDSSALGTVARLHREDTPTFARFVQRVPRAYHIKTHSWFAVSPCQNVIRGLGPHVPRQSETFSVRVCACA